MPSVSNPSAPTSLAGMQAESEKGQSSGYVGIGSEGQVAISGKVGFNGSTPAGKAADTGASSESVTIALLTDTPAVFNAHAKKLNEMRECLRKAGLMA